MDPFGARNGLRGLVVRALAVALLSAAALITSADHHAAARLPGGGPADDVASLVLHHHAHALPGPRQGSALAPGAPAQMPALLPAQPSTEPFAAGESVASLPPAACLVGPMAARLLNDDVTPRAGALAEPPVPPPRLAA